MPDISDPAVLELDFRIEASPDRVFAALTEPEQFAQWFGTAAVDVPLDQLVWRPEEGAHWRAMMVLPDGGCIHWHGTFVEVDPPRRLVITMDDDPLVDSTDPTSFLLTEDGTGTILTVRQSTPGFSPEEQEATRAGYVAFLTDLAALIARDA